MENAIVLQKSLEKQFPDQVKSLQETSEMLFGQIKLLVQLADWQEDQNETVMSQKDIQSLYQMIDMKQEEISTSNGTLNLEFGNEIMSALLQHISPLKKDLVSHVSQLKDLIAI